jgi:hypothetical protein
MAKAGIGDKYANVAYGLVTMSAANTLTFAQINMGMGIFQRTAMLLHRVLFYPTLPSMRELVAATDDLCVAIVTSNRLTAIYDVTEPSIITTRRIIPLGAATNIVELPIISDFTMLPSGGKLIAGNPIYLAAYTGGAAAASIVRCQLDFTFVELADADYLELVQAQYPANIA